MIELRPLDENTLLLVLDMQRMFMESTPWQVEDMPRIVPPIAALAEARPQATLFTRFLTPRTPNEAPGEWARYFERWRAMTTDELDPAMLDIVPELARFVPPAEVIEKRSYGGFENPGFLHRLQERGASTLVLAGVETEVCVLSFALQAIDRGWRIVIVEDGVTSSAPPCHEAALKLFHDRFASQVDLAPAAAVLAAWS